MHCTIQYTITKTTRQTDKTNVYLSLSSPLKTLTCVTGSFIISTSVTGPNIAKYSRSLSELVCQLRPPTNSLLGDGDVDPAGAVAFTEVVTGVERPDDGEVSVEKIAR